MQQAVTGTVSDDNLLSYVVELERQGHPGFQKVGSGTETVMGGDLGLIDGTLLVNGLHQLRVCATDIGGLRTCEERPFGVDGGAKIGVFSISFVDMTIPVAGVPLTITRTYDSRIKTKEDFGYGWTLGMSVIGSVQHNRKPGDGWSISKKIGFGYPLCSEVTELKRHVTEVRLGERTYFRFKPMISETAGGFGFCEGRMEYVQTGGTRPGAKLEIIGKEPFVFQQNSATELRDWDDLTVAEVANVRLTTPEGNVIDLNTGRGVTRFQDRNGNAVEVTKNGLIHNLGLSLPFERDAEGRINKITDPMGYSVRYRYDGNGDLVRFEDQEKHPTEFAYAISHRLDEIVDAFGVRAVTNEYDDAGRLSVVRGPDGHFSRLEHDLLARREIIHEPLGASWEYQYDLRGNILRQTNPLGAVETYEYDERDNRTAAVDALERSIVAAYDDAGNRTATTDDLGHTWYASFNSRSQPILETSPRGSTRRYDYDPFGNLTTKTDALGNSTEYTFYPNGQLYRERDALGRSTEYSYDSRGRLTKRIDALGNVATYEHDLNGNVLHETRTRSGEDGAEEVLVTTRGFDRLGRLTGILHPDGAKVAFEYHGPLLEYSATVDAKGRRREYEFDNRGRRISVRYPDGSAESTSYDPLGRPTATVDALGAATLLHYDLAGQLTDIAHPDGSRRTFELDIAGQVVRWVDENGHATSVEYDRAGRVSMITPDRGGPVTYRYDSIGNRAVVIDGNGHATETFFDALGRPALTVHPDGSESQAQFDALGRRVAVVDETGVSRSFHYDEVGNFSGVTDGRGNRWKYSYNGVHQLIAQEDPLGRVTSYSYDRGGNLSRRTTPLGFFETFRFDPAGNLEEHIDFEGRSTTFAYDPNDRLVATTYSNGATADLAYDLGGRLQRVVSPEGVTAFDHDSRGRITHVEGPSGGLIYSYDQIGNIVSISSSLSEVRYAFDGWNRPSSVLDEEGRTGYQYDSVGNLISTRYPSGVMTTFTYDSRDRMVELVHSSSTGVALSGFRYDYDVAGRIHLIHEFPGGTIRTLEYDSDHQLLSEAVDDQLSIRAVHYGYDSVGNRLFRRDEASAQTWEYDANDRVIRDSFGPWRYDANGNTLVMATRNGDVRFSYNARNSLSSIATDAHNVDFRYDGLGNLVGESLDGQDTEFVVDMNRQLSRIVAKSSPSGTASFTHGNHLISETSAESTRYFHADHLGTTRLLTDIRGNELERLSYDAFGRLESPGASTRMLFTGELCEPVAGLCHLRARFYDPSSGRFLTRDPAPPDRSRTVTLPRYPYAGNSPHRFVDPSGRILAEVAFISVLVGSPYVKTAKPSQRPHFINEGKNGKVRLDVGGLPQKNFYTEALPSLDLYLPGTFSPWGVAFTYDNVPEAKVIHFSAPLPPTPEEIAWIQNPLEQPSKYSALNRPLLGVTANTDPPPDSTDVFVDNIEVAYHTNKYWTPWNCPWSNPAFFPSPSGDRCLGTGSYGNFGKAVEEVAEHELGHVYGLGENHEFAQRDSIMATPYRWQFQFRRKFFPEEVAKITNGGRWR